MQGSGAKPGRCVVDAGNDAALNFQSLTRDTALILRHPESGFAGVWDYMRVVKAPRARNGYARIVLEDSRWHLTQNALSENYNERDSLGNVVDSTKKSIEDLLGVIESATGNKVRFSVGSIPDFEPPAKWAGKSCSEAFESLLKSTGCRCVYSPETQRYVFGMPDGQLPQLPDQIFQPMPPLKIRHVYFHSYPILHESELDVTAVKFGQAACDDTIPNAICAPTESEFVNLSSGEILGSDPLDEDAQVKYRLWKCGDSSKLVTEFRVKSHLHDPMRQSRQRGRIIRDSFPRFPVHQPFVMPGSSIVDSIDDTSGGRVFVTEHPVLTGDGSNYSTTAKMVTGYYEREGSDLKRLTIKKTLNAEADSDLHVFVDWVKPVDSDQSDVDPPVWDELFEKVATALFSKYLGPPASVSNPYPMKLDGMSNVGEVEYDFRLSDRRSYHNFRVAFNFAPGSEGEIR
jgi:hypothetical protein